MSGKASQETLSAPASQPGAPSAPSAATAGQSAAGQNGGSEPTRTEAPAQPKPGKPAARKVVTPPGPAPTRHIIEAEFEAELAKLEGGSLVDDQESEEANRQKADAATPSAPVNKSGAGAVKKTNTQSQTQAAGTQPEAGQKKDPLQEELDAEAAAAGQAAGLQPAPKPEEQVIAELDEMPAGGREELDNWIAKLPKGAQTYIRRLEKQRSQSFQLQPTAANPLAHVENEEQLNAEQKYWQTVAHESRRLLREGTLAGGEITLPDGKKHRFESDEDVNNALTHAEKIIDSIPEWRERLTARKGGTPWLQAEKLVPDFWETGSRANELAVQILKDVPQIKSAFPDYEVKLAHLVRSTLMAEDAQPTKEFPHGKAKWVRLELDAEGRYVQPRAKRDVPVNTKPLTEAAPATVPGPSRPALVQTNGNASRLRDAQAQYEKSRSPEDYDAMVRALEEAA